MKKRYLLKKPMVVNGVRYFAGQEVPPSKLKDFSEKDFDNIYIQDFCNFKSPYNFGLIFLSKEFPHPQGNCSESEECMKKRLLCGMLIDCEKAIKIFDNIFDNTFE